MLQSLIILLFSRLKKIQALLQLCVADLTRLWHSWELTIYLTHRTSTGQQVGIWTKKAVFLRAWKLSEISKDLFFIMDPCSGISPLYSKEGEGERNKKGSGEPVTTVKGTLDHNGITWIQPKQIKKGSRSQENWAPPLRHVAGRSKPTHLNYYVIQLREQQLPLHWGFNHSPCQSFHVSLVGWFLPVKAATIKLCLNQQ